MTVEGLTALVTGASRGIGEEIAETFGAGGANVALAARGETIYEIAERIGGDHTLAVETDITDDGAVERCVEETVARFGGIDCVVNNAGIAGPTKPIEEIEETEWFRTFDVNVTGMARTIAHAVPHLRESDRASIVNVSSISGKRPLINRSPYTASKMAVIGLTRTLAFELGEDEICVNAVCPGATAGPRIDSVIEEQAERREIDHETAKREVFTDDAALSSLVNASDTANMVVYLAGEDGRHITAQDINVDAGTAWY